MLATLARGEAREAILAQGGMDVVVRALEALLLHTAYDSQEHSVPILQIVLHGIDTMDSDALQPYLMIFSSMIALRDGHHRWRVNVAMTRLLKVIANNMRFKLATIACLRMLMQLAANATALATKGPDRAPGWSRSANPPTPAFRSARATTRSASRDAIPRVAARREGGSETVARSSAQRRC